MKKLKVMTVVGTRPEIIRLSEVIKRLDETEAFEHVLVHTGQNYDYELNEIFFEDLGLRKPDAFLNAAKETALATIGQILMAIEPVLDAHKPDAFLVLGDTNSALCALAAKRKKIPVFHMEAGNRSFDQRVPEEINRKIVDHLTDIHMPYSDIAREYLLREGIPGDRIIKTGSPMDEVLYVHQEKIEKSSILEFLKLRTNQYFVVSAHREENVDRLETLSHLVASLNAIAEHYDLPIVVSTHPRTRKRLEAYQLPLHKHIQLIKPLGFTDYVALQQHAKAVLSDSGTISEEASILNLKALNIRTAHERPEAVEEGTVIMTGLKKDRILQGLALLENARPIIKIKDYEAKNVSQTVARVILSYTDYIQENVWKNHK